MGAIVLTITTTTQGYKHNVQNQFPPTFSTENK